MRYKILSSAIFMQVFASQAFPKISVPKTANCFRSIDRADYLKLTFSYPEAGKGTAIYELYEKRNDIKEIIPLENLTCEAEGLLDKYQSIYIYCRDSETPGPITYQTSIFGFAGIYWTSESSTHKQGLINAIIRLKNPHGILTGKYQIGEIFETFTGECLFN